MIHSCSMHSFWHYTVRHIHSDIFLFHELMLTFPYSTHSLTFSCSMHSCWHLPVWCIHSDTFLLGSLILTFYCWVYSFWYFTVQCIDDPLKGSCLSVWFSLVHENALKLTPTTFLSSLSMGTASYIPSDSPLGCLIRNLQTLHLVPDLRASKLILLCSWNWPQHLLDNQSKGAAQHQPRFQYYVGLYSYCQIS